MTSPLERRRNNREPAAEPPFERMRHELLACQMELELRTEVLRCGQEELTNQRNRYLQLFHLAPVGYLVLDLAGHIVEANLAATILLETGLEALLGRELEGMVHPEDRDASPFACGSQSPPQNRELRLSLPNGSTVWAQLHATVWHCQSGDPGLLVTLVAIDHQARQDLRKKERLDSLGVLAGGIAHDFNNVLLAIFGNISLARMQLNDPESAGKRLLDAESSIDRATALTKQLLTFARGGAPVKKALPVADLLRTAAGTIPDDGAITCRVELAGDLWPVEGDEGQLALALGNLAQNAQRAMPEGGMLTLMAENARSSSSDAGFVRISVTDEGAGIAEEDLPRIFDPYYCAGDSGGKGLGLATCHSIIQKHGGKIRVTSVPGKGSTFTLSLPAAGLAPQAAAAEPERPAPGGRVLVMDDDPSVRQVALRLLRELGYMPEGAAHGAEAVEAYQRSLGRGEPFVAVILDLSVPGAMGGREALAQILKMDPGVLAVVSSGYSDDPVMANYRDYGFTAVLEKPYRPQEMARVLAKVIAQQGKVGHNLEASCQTGEPPGASP